MPSFATRLRRGGPASPALCEENSATIARYFNADLCRLRSLRQQAATLLKLLGQALTRPTRFDQNRVAGFLDRSQKKPRASRRKVRSCKPLSASNETRLYFAAGSIVSR